MQLPYVLLQVVLGLVMDPLFEVVEVEYVRVGDLFVTEPFQEEREIFCYFFATEYSIHHMAAKKS